MKASIKIEAIGENTYREFDFWNNLLNGNISGLGDFLGLPKRTYWCAQIVGMHYKFGYDRKFLKPKTDYRKSNQVSSRGVHLWFILESGNIYEIKRPISWQRFERFFFTVTSNGEIKKLIKNEVDEWLKTISE